MAFAARVIEARLALNLIPCTEMPRIAWEALEAGFDGPAIRRLAALESPNFFQVREVLPQAMEEMHLVKLEIGQASLVLAKRRAREILATGSDPFQHLRDFQHLWIEADYCLELNDYGHLDDDVHVARYMGQPENEIRAWLIGKIQELASAQD